MTEATTATVGSVPEPARHDGPGTLFRSKTATAMVLVAVIATNFLDRVIPPAGVPVALAVIWLYLRRTGGRWRDLGLGRPASWPRTIGGAIGLAVVFVFGVNVFIEWLLRTTGLGLPHTPQAEAIRGNAGMLATYLVVAWTTAGFGEEVIWRGFLMRGAARLMGGTTAAWIASLVVLSALFGVLHVYQGAAGVVATGVVGFCFGVVFLLARRSLWLPILLHGTIDTISFIALYLGVAG